MTHFGKSYETGTAASIEEVNRRNMERLYDIKSQQRAANIGFVAKLLGLGGKLYDTLQENKELMRYAKGKDFTVKTSSFASIFKSPMFEHEKTGIVGRDFIEGFRFYEKIKEQKNMFDLLLEED